MARLTRITTRRGDKGRTGLANGSRVDKDSPRIQALGDLDELNAALGLLAVESGEALEESLTAVQQRLFDLGGEIALPGAVTLNTGHITELEAQIQALNADLPPLQEFVLPGGSRAAAQAHLTRAVCRRAERSLWGLSRGEKVNSESLKYLNRLSDLLFVMARHLARQASDEETTWNREP